MTSWDTIPSVALENIYKYMNKRDLLNAGQVSLHWRATMFQKRFFKNFKFKLHIDDDRQYDFFLERLFYLTSDLTIVFDFLNVRHIDKVRRVLYRIAKNDYLKGIRFQTNSVGLSVPGEKYSDEDFIDIEKIFIEPLKILLSRKGACTKVVDLGAIECLSYYAVDFLKSLSKPQELEEITFASIKFDPSHYPILAVEHVFFEKCTSLKILSLDYDTLNDDILRTLQILPLKKFLICVHGVERQHPNIVSETAWAEFSSKFENLDLILMLLYAYEAVELLQHLLCPSMPVTHLRVLFCNFMNVEALDLMSMYYSTTLKSIQWIDSAFEETRRNVMDLYMRSGQDPFVMMAWRCKKLEEIVIHGYVLDPHNLVGVSRLCSQHLKRLEVSMLDSPTSSKLMFSFVAEICSQLNQAQWRPLDSRTIHPALGYMPASDDLRDEYALNIIRSDLSQ